MLGFRSEASLYQRVSPSNQWKSRKVQQNPGQEVVYYVSESQLDWNDNVPPLFYASNTQVHNYTGTTPFDLTLVRAPTTYMVDLQNIAKPQDITREMTPTKAKWYSLKPLDAIFRAAKTTLDKAQERCEADFDRSVCFTLQMAIEDYVHLDRSQKEEQESEHITNKLLPKSTGPFKVLKSRGHTVTIDSEGIQDTVTIDQTSLAP